MDAPADAPPPRKTRRDWRRWGPRAVFESLLIVFSVVLALALTDWAEQRKTDRQVAEMRGFLIAEIRANRDDLASDYYVPHHEALKLAFASAGGTPDRRGVDRAMAEPAIERLFGGGGLHLAAPRDAVWESLAASDLLQHMEPKEVFLLARVYRGQESLEGVNRAGYDNALGLLDILSDEGDAHRQMMRMTLYLEDLIQQERNVLRLYDQALAELDPEGEAATPRTRDAGRRGG